MIDKDAEILLFEGLQFEEIKLRRNEHNDIDVVSFVTNHPRYDIVMQHIQDCCENVYLDDISGDLDDIVGCPIMDFSERTGKLQTGDELRYMFYHISTIKGTVVLLWRGTSNGYYSMDVDVSVQPKSRR